MPNLSGEKIHVLTWVWYIIEGITGIYIFSSLVTNKIIPVTLFAAQIDPGKVKWIDRGKTKTDVFYCQIYAEYLLTNIHFSILAYIYIARAGTKIFSYFIEWETQVLRNNMSIIIEVSNYKRLSFTQLTGKPKVFENRDYKMTTISYEKAWILHATNNQETGTQHRSIL